MDCFYTLKYGVIRDRRLGFAYYMLQVLAMMFCFARIFVEQGYLEYAQLAGFVRPELIGITHRELGTWDPPYCHHQQIGCVFWDAAKLSSNALGQDSLRLPTRLQSSLQTSSCAPANCHLNYTETARSTAYIAAVETVLMELHGSVQAIPFAAENPPADKEDHHPEYADSHQHLHGALLGPAEEVMQSLPKGTVDTFTLRTLLRAANTSLDAPSDSPRSGVSSEHGETFRDEGIILNVDYLYSNTHCITLWWLALKLVGKAGRCHITYQIKVTRVAESEFEWKELEEHTPTATTGPKQRTVHLVHGVIIHFRRGGKVGRFSPSAMITSLVLSLGCLSLAQVVLDVVWQYLYPLLGWKSNTHIMEALYESVDATSTIKYTGTKPFTKDS